MGLTVACMALYAMSLLHPATFHQVQMMRESDPHPPEQGQMDCTATTAELLEMHAHAVLLLLFAVAQVLMAMAAIAGTSHVLTFLAMLLSIPMAWRLTAVFAGVGHVATIRRCHGNDIYHQMLVIVYTIITPSFGLLFIIAGFVIALLSKLDG